MGILQTFTPKETHLLFYHFPVDPLKCAKVHRWPAPETIVPWPAAKKRHPYPASWSRRRAISNLQARNPHAG